MQTALLTLEGAQELDLTDEAATARGVAAWLKCTTEPPSSAAALTFVVGHRMGERIALRRAAQLLADPRTRGKEREILLALADGLDDKAAVRQARRPRR